MKLIKGDIIVCIINGSDSITYSKEYLVKYTRVKSRWVQDDICIEDDGGYDWWFGQIGSTESWTDFFITKKQWDRDNKLNNILE